MNGLVGASSSSSNSKTGWICGGGKVGKCLEIWGAIHLSNLFRKFDIHNWHNGARPGTCDSRLIWSSQQQLAQPAGITSMNKGRRKRRRRIHTSTRRNSSLVFFRTNQLTKMGDGMGACIRTREQYHPHTFFLHAMYVWHFQDMDHPAIAGFERASNGCLKR